MKRLWYDTWTFLTGLFFGAAVGMIVTFVVLFSLWECPTP